MRRLFKCNVLFCACLCAVGVCAAAETPYREVRLNPEMSVRVTTFTRTKTDAARIAPRSHVSGMFFDGDGDVLTLVRDQLLQILQGEDFTIDLWVSTLVSDHTFPQTLFYQKNNSRNDYLHIFLSQGKIVFFMFLKGKEYRIETPEVEWAEQFYHIAFIRSGSTIRIYRNGREIGNGLYDGVVFFYAPICIGAVPDNAGAESEFCGYINYVRVTRRRALWFGDFTPPSTVGEYGFTDSATVLFLNFDDAESNCF